MKCPECNGFGGFGVDLHDSCPCPHCDNGYVEVPIISRGSNIIKPSSVADKIIKILKKEGFTIQRYDAISTKSVYLKLDFGVSNSIRISDHRSKEGLHYKYNILSIVKKYRLEKFEGRYEQHYYPIDGIDKLVDDIIRHKKQKMYNMGEPAYSLEMRKMLIKHRDDKGFWSQSFYV